MKKILLLAIAILSIGFLSLSPDSHAWNDCPYGLVNDTYPGSCPRYVDTDGDGICDHSQLPPEEREASINSSVGTSYKGSSFEITSSPIKGVIITLLIVSLAALFTEIAVKRDVMRKITSRYIWNVLLVAGFLISALSGVLLLFIKNASFLTLHILSSLILLWMGIYHIIKRIKYYTLVPIKRREG